ncbi:hypothetical protein B0T19DRAFT_443514 [Cercophora scortea]|uniref:Ubiquitin carboxyl-terminal hydrolase n=1 Tax=Cercophora scortea TaxID=314031 RepID=A0AAE0M961_9PEZI|nr:hypothetical protein B0T19DRAFT_443514 [Cercophora scortea]
MASRVFTVLENNPEVMNDLANKLGLSPALSFHDVYSLDDPDILAMVPRPVFAIVAIIPFTDAWEQDRKAEDANMALYDASGPTEPVLWFKQTIVHGCGLIGFLHCVLNGVPKDMIVPGSALGKVLEETTPLGREDRARYLNESQTLFDASEAAARLGDTVAPSADRAERLGQHFVAFVKGRDGHLWELEGSRKGPIDRGLLGEDEDLLSEKAVELGIGRLIKMQLAGGGDLRFSCVALALQDR